MKKIITTIIIIFTVSSVFSQIPPRNREMSKNQKAKRIAYNNKLNNNLNNNGKEIENVNPVYLEIKYIKGKKENKLYISDFKKFDSKISEKNYRIIETLREQMNESKMSIVSLLGNQGYKIITHAFSVAKINEIHYYTIEIPQK